MPEGWKRVRIGDVAQLNPPRFKPGYDDATPLVFVPMPRVAEEFGGIDVTERRPFSSIKRGYTQFQPGDVLFAKITPCMENGKIAIVPEIQPPLGYGSTEFFVMRPRAQGLAPWVAYCVARSRFRDLARKKMQGAVGQRRVPKVWMEDASVPLAPLPEQRRIVARIEGLFARLGVGVAALKRAQANLERYRASVLKAAVEGRLTEQWREENPPEETGEVLLARILAQRRKRWEDEQLAKFKTKGHTPPKNWKTKYKEPVAPDTGRLPELPEGWCWATVDQVSHGVHYGSSTRTSPGRNGVPVLRMGNIQDGMLNLDNLKYLPLDHSEFPRLLLAAGDLLFNRTNSAELVGKTAVYRGRPAPCSFASYLIRVRMLCPHLSQVVANALNGPHGRAWVASVVSQQVGQANVNGTKLRAFPFPLPPESEQLQIIGRSLEAADSVTHSIAAINELLLRRAATLRQSILKRAFEGRLVPQDADEEPATVLLERIRAEREGGGKKKRMPKRRSDRPKRTRKRQVS